MEGRKRALVVGINAYGGGIPRLGSAVRDAEAVAQQLERAHRFEVELIRDAEATTAAIMASVARAAAAGLTPDDSFVMYFAGHGTIDQSDEPEGFLLGSDAQRTKDAAWLGMASLKTALVEGLSCRHLLLVLDCCNAGAFRFAQTRAVGGTKRPLYKSQYERYRNGVAWHVLTAAAHDETADDAAPFTNDRGESQGQRGHSPFAQALIEGLLGAADTSRRDVGPDGVLTATELHQYIHEMVTVKHRQTPGIYPLRPDNKGEFVFHAPGVTLELEDDPPFDASNNPWLGPRPFTAADQDLFFGRKEATEGLRARVEAERFVAVVGASGCGKSSLVRAGLLPALEPPAWVVVESGRLSPDPTAHLADAQARLATAPAGGRQLLVIDQFEDLFRSVDDAAQSRFLDELRALVEAENGPTVVITLRSDFEPRVASALGDLWTEDARYAVPDFTGDDLEDVILGPAQARAVFFEPAKIVDTLERSVANAPGAAPLLSLTLESLYRRAHDRHVANDPADRTISQEDYDAEGGVVGLVHRRASELYESADPDGKETIRRILLRLVDQKPNGNVSRNVNRDELRFGREHDQLVSSVLDDFIAARLLIVGHADGRDYVEPAHDALVSTWDRLRDWLAQTGPLEIIRDASKAARDWNVEDDMSKTSKRLWNQDPRLTELARRDQNRELTALEQEFTKVSFSRQRRLARIRRVAIISLMILTVVAVAAGIFALVKRSEALEEARRASSRALAADALNNATTETDLAALVALEGVRVANTADARGSLAGVLSVPTRFLQRTDVHDDEITAIAFGESGLTAATADAFGVVALWEVNEPFASPQATPLDVIETDLEIRDLFVTDEAEFPVLAFDTAGVVWLLDFTTGEHIFLPPPEDFVDATVNLDLTVFAGVTADGMLSVYTFEDDLTFTPGPKVEVGPTDVIDLTVSPDGTTVAWGNGPDLAVWSWRDGAQPQTENVVDDDIVRTEIAAISFSPDADPDQAVVAVGILDGTVDRRRSERPDDAQRSAPRVRRPLFDLAFKPDVNDDDGDITFTLASTHGNGDVNLFEVVPGQGFEPFGFALDTMLGHNDETRKVAFAPDGRIVSGDFSGRGHLVAGRSHLVAGLRVPLPAERTSPLRDAAFLTANQIVAVDADFTAWSADFDAFDIQPIVDELRVTSVDAASDVIAVGLAEGSAAILDPEGVLVRSLGADHPSVRPRRRAVERRTSARDVVAVGRRRP